MKGIVKIKKVYSDGKEELVAYDENVISINLARSFVNLFTNNTPSDTTNLLTGYFQAGRGSHTIPEDPVLRKRIFSLDSPFGEADYGVSTTSQLDVHDQVYIPNFSTSKGASVLKGTFVELGDSFSTRVGEDSVYYRLNIGETTANGESIKEFGLFSRNPNNFKNTRSSLIAYKALDEAIEKSDLFSVVIDWQIKFVDSAQELSSEIGGDSGVGTGYNVVMIMADDLGIDQLGLYDSINPYDVSNAVNPNATPASQIDDPTNGTGLYPSTPTLSAMAEGGMIFFNARANTMCSPTRANILTGKNAFSSSFYTHHDEHGTLLYKGFWGHGIGTVFTEKFQKLRGGLKGLGLTYNYHNCNPAHHYVELGDATSLMFDVVGGGGADSDEERKTWLSSWNNKSITGGAALYHALGTGIPPNFTILPDLIRNPDNFPPDRLPYKSAMVGKWHLTEWKDLMVYYEEPGASWGNSQSYRKYGNDWVHIRNIGRWDYARAMFANLDRIPIPGHAGDTPNTGNYRPWFAVQDTYDLSDTNMGYVNYFQYNYDGLDSGTSTVTTVSDTGYTTFLNSGRVANRNTPNYYQQGDVSSYATNKTFADASSLFNSMEEPFFLYLPLNTPHAPWTYPPSSTVYNSYYNNNHVQKIYETTTGGTAASAAWINHNAMVENMDYCLKGFLDNLDNDRKQRTIFIFQGDNGTPGTIFDDAYYYASALVDNGGLETLSGLGPVYAKLIFPKEFPDTSAGQGGNNNSPGRLKASCYDRGVLIPYIVSASFMDSIGVANTSSNAFIDVVDIYDTVAHIAGISDELVNPGGVGRQETITDGISFLPVLRGEVDASGHTRQYSFFETFLPIGNSIGLPTNTGTYQGYIGNYAPVGGDGDDPPDGTFDEYPWSDDNNYGASTVPDGGWDNTLPDGGPPRVGRNTFPYERRRGFISRASAGKLGGQEYSPAAGICDCDPTQDPVPEASAGMWKLIRPTAGAKYDELYHLKNNNFEDVDPYEFTDLIPSSYKGSVITTKMANAVTDFTDPNDENWHLLRIYTYMALSLQYYLQYRKELPTTVDTMYASFPEDAARVALPNIAERVDPL